MTDVSSTVKQCYVAKQIEEHKMDSEYKQPLKIITLQEKLKGLQTRVRPIIQHSFETKHTTEAGQENRSDELAQFLKQLAD